MYEYELMFVVDPLNEDLEEKLASTLDAFVGGHGAVTLVTLNLDGSNAVAAAHEAVAKLESLGVGVRRLYDDLVTRKQIAIRAAVSTQGVGLWARGERQADRPFPQPFILAGGGLWLWGEVNEWLRQSGHKHDEVRHPSAAESAQINDWLVRGRIQIDFSWEGPDVDKSLFPQYLRRSAGPQITIQAFRDVPTPTKWVDPVATRFSMAS
jgi:hypothetical protein